MGLALALIVMGVLILLDRMGAGIRIKRGVAMGRRCPWGRRYFSQQKKFCRLDDSNHWGLNFGGKVLLHPYQDPFSD